MLHLATYSLALIQALKEDECINKELKYMNSNITGIFFIISLIVIFYFSLICLLKLMVYSILHTGL